MWRVPALLISLAAGLALAQSSGFMEEGAKALEAKNYRAAAESFSKAVAANPKDYAAHFQLAFSYSMIEKFAEAIPEYKAALDLHPGLYDAEINLGMCLLQVKSAGEAVTPLQAAAAQRPKEYKPAYYLGMARLETRDFAGAATAFTSAAALNPAAPGPEVGLAHALAALGRLDSTEAELHFRKAAVLDPTYRQDLLALGEVYEKAGRTAQAIAIYREFPENLAAQERMGALLAQSGHAADGIPALESAVAKSPTAANRIALAQAYVTNKEPLKALPLAAQAIAAEPNDYNLRMFYGILLRDQRKFGEAEPQFLAASKLKPAAVQPWNELAGLYVVAEQYPQAISALDRVRALGGDLPFLDYLRAISFDHLHQLKEALANYNKFLEESRGKSPDEEFKARQRVRIIQNELNRR